MQKWPHEFSPKKIQKFLPKIYKKIPKNEKIHLMQNLVGFFKVFGFSVNLCFFVGIFEFFFFGGGKRKICGHFCLFKGDFNMIHFVCILNV
jgi:hypothetical protein